MTKTNNKPWLLIEAKKRMLDIGMNMSKLAAAVGVSRCTVDRWLRSPGSAKLEDIRDILRVLDYEKSEAALIIAQIAEKSWR